MDYRGICANASRRMAIGCSVCVLLVFGSSLYSQQPDSIAISDGYLFLDGQYIAPPYDVRVDNDSVKINGEVLQSGFFDIAELESESPEPVRRPFGRRMGMRGRMNGRGLTALDPLARIASQIDQLRIGAIVVVYPQKRPLIVYPDRHGYKLLGVLNGSVDAEAPAEMIPADRAIWSELVANFQPTTEFMTRSTAELQNIERVANDVNSTVAANQLVSRISYPLTVFAMIVVVLGFGHLLSTRPALETEGSDQSANRQIIVKSLTIIALLSAIDLIWTIAATNAGTMRELNPLANRLITDPTQLMLFKLTVTGTAIGILYLLHNRQFAQVATWWCCLLLTLLTARWVVFQSMFL